MKQELYPVAVQCLDVSSVSISRPLGKRSVSFVSDGKQEERQQQKHASAVFSGPSRVYTRTRLTQTLERPSVPSYTSPCPPDANGSRPILSGDESVYDVGSIVLVPHMLLSSRRHFRKAGLEGLRRSSAYASLRGEWESLARQRTLSR